MRPTGIVLSTIIWRDTGVSRGPVARHLLDGDKEAKQNLAAATSKSLG